MALAVDGELFKRVVDAARQGKRGDFADALEEAFPEPGSFANVERMMLKRAYCWPLLLPMKTLVSCLI